MGSSTIRRVLISSAWFFVLITVIPTSLLAHRSGCHRSHNCPSDTGAYICGDRGYCLQCPDNKYCQNRRRRTSPAAPSHQPTKQESHSFSGTVVGVADGDTIDISHNGQPVRVRLHGIDTPEMGQAFGNKAKHFTARLVFQQNVTVRITDKDRYGRLVGEVILDDGRILNHELVKVGLAWWYRRYASDNTTLPRLEAEARIGKMGLWSGPHAVPPWEWRKMKRTAD